MDNNLSKTIQERTEQLDKEYQAQGFQNAPFPVVVAAALQAEAETKNLDKIQDK